VPPSPPLLTASSRAPLGASTRLPRAVRAVRRAVRLRRRLLAAGLTAGAVAIGLGVIAPAPPPTTSVVVASADLPGGGALGSDDLTVRRLPPSAVPAGSAGTPRRWLGRVLAAPVRAGEPITDMRVVGPGLVAGYGPGAVAAPVRIADADAVALVRVGDRVDVLAPDPTGELLSSVAVAGASVVAVPRADDALAAGTPGALVVLAVTPEEALQLARHSVLGPLLLTLRR
jgi:pilus assembly protein CpaB